MCKDKAQEGLAAKSRAFAGELQSNYQTIFGQDQDIFNTLTRGWKRIFEAGPGRGMSPEEEAARRTEVSERTAAASRDISRKVSETMAARGGGNISIPSGALAQVQAEIATQQKQQEALGQEEITGKSYDIGRDIWKEAGRGLMGAPSVMAPALEAGKLTLGGYDTASTLAQRARAARTSWVGALTGLAGSAVAGLTGGL